MFRLECVKRLPPNVDAFVEEIAEGIEGLYGRDAAIQYRVIGARVLQSSVEHAEMDVLAVNDGPHTAGMLIAYLRHRVGYISFLHVLHRYEGRNVERRLVRECVKALRTRGVEGIVFDGISFGTLDLEGVFPPLDFERVERGIMAASLRDGQWASYEPGTPEMGVASFPEAARAIVDAYADHPGRRLHVEVRRAAYAADFLKRVVAEDYGYFRPSYMRGIWRERRCLGVIAGCEAAPGYGFVLQVAVRPEEEHHGFGTTLLRDLSHAFWSAGMHHVALGVTLDNPARMLYERLGFVVVRPVDVYAWWRQKKAGAE